MLGIELTPEHPVDRIADLGVRAADAGFDTAFVSSHFFNRDPFVACDRLARATDLRVGPGVINPYETHPVTLAARVASLDEASDGRAVYGVGPGDPSALSSLGLDEERGLRSVLEAFSVARDLWAGETVDHDGTFRASGAALKFQPPQGRALPVYVGGEGPHMCRMAGKHADGLLFNGSHPDDLAWARARLAEGREDRPAAADGREDRPAAADGREDRPAAADGREDRPAAADGREDRPADRGDVDLAAYASVSVAEDADAARETARQPVAFIAAGAAPPVLDRHGIDRARAEAIGEALSAGAFRDAFDRVTPAMVDAFCMAGTPDEVAARMAAVLEHADSLVVGSPLGPDLASAVELVGAAAREAGVETR